MKPRSVANTTQSKELPPTAAPPPKGKPLSSTANTISATTNTKGSPPNNNNDSPHNGGNKSKAVSATTARKAKKSRRVKRQRRGLEDSIPWLQRAMPYPHQGLSSSSSTCRTISGMFRQHAELMYAQSLELENIWTEPTHRWPRESSGADFPNATTAPPPRHKQANVYHGSGSDDDGENDIVDRIPDDYCDMDPSGRVRRLSKKIANLTRREHLAHLELDDIRHGIMTTPKAVDEVVLFIRDQKSALGLDTMEMRNGWKQLSPSMKLHYKQKAKRMTDAKRLDTEIEVDAKDLFLSSGEEDDKETVNDNDVDSDDDDSDEQFL